MSETGDYIEFHPPSDAAPYLLWRREPSSAFEFRDAQDKPVVTIHFDPPRVELAPGVSWDEASLVFWEHVQTLAGRSVVP